MRSVGVALCAAFCASPSEAFSGLRVPSLRPTTAERSSSSVLEAGKDDKSPIQTLTAEFSKEPSPSLPFMWTPKWLAEHKDQLPAYSGFDPLCLSELLTDPSKGEKRLDWLQAAEIKHGRVAMLGTLGYIGTDIGIRFPGPMHEVSSFDAHEVFVNNGQLTAMAFWVALLELIDLVPRIDPSQPQRAPGEYGFDPLGFQKNKSPKDLMTMRTKEIKNGRLAMLAFIGMFIQSAYSENHSFPYATGFIA
uniref:Uncharacterized protein n=1 Tax=Chromera velia CCMP2878 TaxID=1169474 RepID=A0A0G4HG87_9ALVE|mmetsp:Transcript_12364/g.23973  ORF Transcript_12364/g.23973 Transcript_12364/m.23973 type:complete len:248 (+) Transcript_12364:158-901(+)|eukprot:Cvel_6744.t1-p1 / transcript=Cvel_6744.t1 / gene=Cvel_6744 / organism=Chromera_velia_CCMP2878 / gene_product=Chlorophyll a-b binding protein 7, chloroplastic, putative / transcript_product=Chlorophyll a-b binding protein 7, chloroplastic, putative / location=Cvel_scaffold337:71743-74386(-) / protein_length=247 / sequence_SO=supercontig / SO=protein_coding / is_pseudo=false